jgi:hypothetical protein
LQRYCFRAKYRNKTHANTRKMTETAKSASETDA